MNIQSFAKSVMSLVVEARKTGNNWTITLNGCKNGEIKITTTTTQTAVQKEHLNG